MNKKQITIALLAVTVLAACKKKLPIACITSPKTEALVNEDISFTSCATDAAKISWGFGDATTADGESATHKFTKAGTYAVNQRVTSKKDKASDNAVVIVTIKDVPPAPPAPPEPAPKFRYLTKIVLKSFSALNGSAKWDAGTLGFGQSDADLFVNFSVDGTVLFHSEVIIDAAQAILPKTYNLSSFNIKLESKPYTLDIGDDDGSNTGWDKIKALTSNLGTAAATNGKITLVDGDCSIDVYFEER
jgi:PKD repeat protein